MADLSRLLLCFAIDTFRTFVRVKVRGLDEPEAAKIVVVDLRPTVMHESSPTFTTRATGYTVTASPLLR